MPHYGFSKDLNGVRQHVKRTRDGSVSYAVDVMGRGQE
jgi:hypothetical protein